VRAETAEVAVKATATAVMSSSSGFSILPVKIFKQFIMSISFFIIDDAFKNILIKLNFI
jgi:hypothetical protein